MRRFPKAILFDFGDTVLSHSGWDDLAGNRALLQHATENPDHVDEYAVRKRARELDQFFIPLLNSTGLEIPTSLFQSTLYDGLGVRFALSPAEREMVFYRATADFQPVPGIADLLEFLRGRGVRMGIVSNFPFQPACIEHDLKRHGLLDHFAFVATSSYYGIRKPNPMLFDIACKRIGVAKGSVWFAGDSYEFDMVGASRAGLYPVWYNPAGQKRPGDLEVLEIREWRQLVGILEAS